MTKKSLSWNGDTFLSLLWGKGRQRKTDGAGEKAKEQGGWKCVSRLIRGQREKMETGSLSDRERVNDSKSGTEKQGGGEDSPWAQIKAPHSHLKILTRGLSQWPITHPHQHIPNPEHIHRCRWAHSGWHQPRRLHTPRPGQTEQRTASVSWFISALKKYIQWNERTEAEEGCILILQIPLGSDTVSRAWRRLNIIDGLCNCGGYPGPISFQVIRQREQTNRGM